jgi:hypothetical protein
MRRVLYWILLLLLAANAPGCGWQSPGDSAPPPGVIKNPHRPDPESIKTRKQMLIHQRKGSGPSRFVGRR